MKKILFSKINRGEWSDKKKDGEAYIYLFGVEGRTKIGFSRNPIRRASMVESTIGLDIEEIYLSDPVPFARGTEKALHNHFSEIRMNGEWFAITAEDAFKRSLDVEYFSPPAAVKIKYKPKSIDYKFVGYRKVFDAMYHLISVFSSNQIRNIIKRMIREQFSTQTEAAKNIGISRVYLSKALADESMDIPDAVLNWCGFEKHKKFSYEEKTK